MRPVSAHRNARSAPTRFALTGLAASLILLLIPAQAFAASQVNVEGTDYVVAASGSGLSGGTWAWDGADNMALDGYDGGAITAIGDLIMDLSGENTITDPDGKAIYVDGGDLTIEGDGSLDVVVTDANDRTGAIQVNGGDLSIEGTTVTVDTTTDSGAYGIAVFNGNIDITDSDVDVTCDDIGETVIWNAGVIAASSLASRPGSGNITITDSTVSSIATGPSIRNYGIVAASENGVADSSTLSIVRSDVTAAGPCGAIAALGDNAQEAGSITITDSTIITPAGAKVVDVNSPNEYCSMGQIIGTGDETLTYILDEGRNVNPAISTAVVIKAKSDPTPVPGGDTPNILPVEQAAAKTTGTVAEVIPKTYDGNGFALVMLTAALVSGAALIALSRYGATRRVVKQAPGRGKHGR